MQKLRTTPAGLILTPGASADREHGTLVAIEKGLPEIVVVRLTLATTSVPNAVKKVVAAGEALAKVLDVKPNQIAYGGRSFGGRACSVAVSEGMPAAALVLLSYPLHPPGKPEKLRTEHFPSITRPALFISGEKDPFGTPAEFETHLRSFGGRADMEWIPGTHSPKGQDDTIIALMRRYFRLE